MLSAAPYRVLTQLIWGVTTLIIRALMEDVGNQLSCSTGINEQEVEHENADAYF